MSGQSGHDYTTARLIAKQFSGHGGMDDLTIERSFDSQATWVIDVLSSLFFWHFMCVCVCTTRHWQTSGRTNGAGINVCAAVPTFDSCTKCVGSLKAMWVIGILG